MSEAEAGAHGGTVPGVTLLRPACRLTWRVLRVPGVVRALTSAALAAIGIVHVAWSRGSAFPYPNRKELAQTVVGSDEVPGAAATLGVAGALFAAAALVADVPVGSRRLRRVGVAGVATVLGARGVLGITGRTGDVVKGSTGARFKAFDRTYFGPLCLALAAGAASTLLPRRR